MECFCSSHHARIHACSCAPSDANTARTACSIHQRSRGPASSRSGPPTSLIDGSASPRKVLSQLATVRHALRRPLRNSNVNANMLSLDPEGVTG